MDFLKQDFIMSGELKDRIKRIVEDETSHLQG